MKDLLPFALPEGSGSFMDLFGSIYQNLLVSYYKGKRRIEKEIK